MNDSTVAGIEPLIPGGLGQLDIPMEQQLVIERGLGARVWDVNGREYVDCVMGSGPLILGHAHPAFVEAIQSQAARGSTFYAFSPQIMQLVEELIEAIPCAEQIKFTSTGSEAIQYALRLARAHTGRDKILKFEGGYHGHSEYAVFSYGPKELRPFPEAYPQSLEVTEGVRQDVLVAPFNDLERTEEILAAHGDEVACIILEPVQRAITPRQGFLQGLRQLADKHGALLIYDEIVTGFRLAYGGAQEFYGVEPDIAVYGKAMSGGYPIAALAGRAEVMAFSDPAHPSGKIHFSGTFNGHALGAAAALATLAVLREPGTYERLHEVGRRFSQGLSGRFRKHGVSGQALGVGPWLQVVLGDEEIDDYRSLARADLAGAAALNMEVFKRGVYNNPGSKIYLSLAHTDEDLDFVLDAYDQALEELVQRSGRGCQHEDRDS